MPRGALFDFPSAFDSRWKIFTTEHYHRILGKAIKYILEKRYWDKDASFLELAEWSFINVNRMCESFSFFTRAQMLEDTAETRALKRLVGYSQGLDRKHVPAKRRRKRLVRLYKCLRQQIKSERGGDKSNWQGVVLFSLTVKTRCIPRKKGKND